MHQKEGIARQAADDLHRSCRVVIPYVFVRPVGKMSHHQPCLSSGSCIRSPTHAHVMSAVRSWGRCCGGSRGRALGAACSATSRSARPAAASRPARSRAGRPASCSTSMACAPGTMQARRSPPTSISRYRDGNTWGYWLHTSKSAMQILQVSPPGQTQPPCNQVLSQRITMHYRPSSQPYQNLQLRRASGHLGACCGCSLTALGVLCRSSCRLEAVLQPCHLAAEAQRVALQRGRF